MIKKHSKFDRCMMPPSPTVIAALKSEFDRSGEDEIKKFLKKLLILTNLRSFCVIKYDIKKYWLK
jgi:hypothetical protein